MDVLTVLTFIVAAAIVAVIVLRSRNRGPAPASGTIPLMEGRLMHVSAEPGAVVDALEGVLATYRERPHPGVPRLAPAGYRWSCAPAEEPSAVYVCADEDGGTLVITLRPVDGGTEIGMTPLNRRPDRLLVSMMGHLHARIPVTARGVVPSGCLTLTAPSVPRTLVEDTLTLAGYPLTAKNLEIVAEQALAQTLAKASQFVAKRDRGPAGEAWVAEWQSHDREWASAVERIERVLQDLARWDSRVVTQIQDVPLRVQAELVESIGARAPGVWDELEAEPSDRGGPSPRG